MKIRDNERALAALHAVSRSLTANPQDERLLHQLAGKSMNVLAADIVTIYEYLEAEDPFHQPHAQAGRLLSDVDRPLRSERKTGPYLLLEMKRKAEPLDDDDNLYFALDSINDPIMNSPDRLPMETESFILREKIRSSVGIVLRVGEETRGVTDAKIASEIVGVMFVHFRRPHAFSLQEKQILKTLASNAAIAIKKRRVFATIAEEIREILTTVDMKKLLRLVVKRAVKITGGDVGNIRLLEGPNLDDLVAHARFPDDEPVIEAARCVKLGAGHIGKVAREKAARIVRDIQDHPDYEPYFRNLRSGIYVPLLDGDKNLLGVLATGSRTPSKFEERDRLILEALADQTVIAMQNINKQEQQLAPHKTMARIGDCAGNFTHTLNNKVGAIRQFAKMLIDEVQDREKSTVSDIVRVSEEILYAASKLNVSISERVEGTDVLQAISMALESANLPNNITISSCGSEDHLPLVKGDQMQLQNIFMNLIQNAVEAMPDGGKLTIIAEALEPDGTRGVKISITDTGHGIAQDLWEKIFERNFSTKGGAHGFGLWWSKNYIERLGGRLEAQSGGINQGACFTVSLPE
jgi:signal transduction histidine kinase